MMCKCWKMEPCDRPTFAELRSHFEGVLDGQHASYYVDFTASLTPISDQKKGEEHVMKKKDDEGTSHVLAVNIACVQE